MYLNNVLLALLLDLFTFIDKSKIYTKIELSQVILILTGGQSNFDYRIKDTI